MSQTRPARVEEPVRAGDRGRSWRLRVRIRKGPRRFKVRRALPGHGLAPRIFSATVGARRTVRDPPRQARRGSSEVSGPVSGGPAVDGTERGRGAPPVPARSTSARSKPAGESASICRSSARRGRLAGVGVLSVRPGAKGATERGLGDAGGPGSRRTHGTAESEAATHLDPRPRERPAGLAVPRYRRYPPSTIFPSGESDLLAVRRPIRTIPSRF